MPDAEVQLQPDSTGKQIDNTTVTTGAGTVYRQRISIADASAANNAGVTAAGALKTDASAVTQPVSAASLPLPAGAALDASLTTIDADIRAQAKLTDTQPVSVAFPTPHSATLDDVLLEMRAMRMGMEMLLDQYGAGLRLLEVADAG
jgi:hypothetical protein